MGDAAGDSGRRSDSSGRSGGRARPAPFPAGGLPLSEFGNSSIALPTLPAAWIEPAAAAALTEQFKLKLDALWLQIRSRAHRRMPTTRIATAGSPRGNGRSSRTFALLKDAYLLYAEYMSELVELAQADAACKKRLEFIVRQYIDAIAPSNFLATNPDAMKLALESGGASLAQGLSNLAADAQRGRIAMTDESAFEVGVNLAVTPGSVVFRNELIELIQYAPTTKQVFRRPLVIIPPCINKYYILDLQPDNSFVRYAVEQGHTVFMVSWRNIPTALGSLRWDDYLEDGVLTAIDQVARHHRQQYRQRARLLRRRHAARVRAGGAGGAACQSGRQRDVPDHHARFHRPRRHRRLHLARRARRARAHAAVGRARPGQRTRKRIREPARERTGLELRRRQLSQGSDAARVRPAVLERRFREPARAHVSRLRHQHVSGQSAARARAR